MSQSSRSDRQERFWSLHDFSQGHGLEIGPLHRPTLLTEESKVQYADLYTTSHFREYYRDHPQITTETIPEIDFVLLKDGVVQRLAAATATNAPYDWVIASHVIEHVPDAIDWLDQVAEITADGGALIMAVPDRRFTFDLHRPPTTVGQLLQAHELADDRPSTRAIYDHFSSHVTVMAQHLWTGGTPPGYSDRTYRLEQALEAADRRRNGDYVDAHVWIFTPESFLSQMAELRQIGKSSWFVERMVPTTRNTLEFMVLMRRIPRGHDTTRDPEGEVLPSPDGPDWLIDQYTVDARVRKLNKQVRKLSKDVSRLRRRIASMESSRRWRVGGAVLAPVRPAVRLGRKLRAGLKS